MASDLPYEARVDREYDIFEKLPEGAVLWRGAVQGKENAIAKLREVAAGSTNEHFVLHVASNAVIARIPEADGSDSEVR